MDKVRCMLHQFGLSKKLWAEAAFTACYLINRSPHAAFNFEVPEEVWSSSKPTYDHLRTFGCIAYVHASQGKLCPRALKGVFLGYPFGIKGYKIWLIEEKKRRIRQDVTYNEKCSDITLVQGVDTNQKHKVNQNEVPRVLDIELSSNDAYGSYQGGDIQFNPDMAAETDHQNSGTRTSHEVETEQNFVRICHKIIN